MEIWNILHIWRWRFGISSISGVSRVSGDGDLEYPPYLECPESLEMEISYILHIWRWRFGISSISGVSRVSGDGDLMYPPYLEMEIWNILNIWSVQSLC